MKSKWVRISSFVLIVILLAMVPAIFSASAATAYSGGTGTASDPYLIATPADFYNVRNHTGKYFLQVCDISMEGYSLTPVSSFSGTYDGGGYAITDVTMTIYTDRAGLFGNNSGTIKNINLENCSITIYGSSVAFSGGIAARNYQGGQILNCFVSGTVQGSSSYVNAEVYTGGIVGLNQGLIENCINSASVTSKSKVADVQI